MSRHPTIVGEQRRGWVSTVVGDRTSRSIGLSPRSLAGGLGQRPSVDHQRSSAHAAVAAMRAASQRARGDRDVVDGGAVFAVDVADGRACARSRSGRCAPCRRSRTARQRFGDACATLGEPASGATTTRSEKRLRRDASQPCNYGRRGRSPARPDDALPTAASAGPWRRRARHRAASIASRDPRVSRRAARHPSPSRS